jgi:hypothetical protein
VALVQMDLPLVTVAFIIATGQQPMSEEAVQPEYVILYRQAFAEYGSHALWSLRAFEAPSPEDALVVARALRTEGDLVARRLAERIEQACHAAV